MRVEDRQRVQAPLSAILKMLESEPQDGGAANRKPGGLQAHNVRDTLTAQVAEGIGKFQRIIDLKTRRVSELEEEVKAIRREADGHKHTCGRLRTERDAARAEASAAAAAAPRPSAEVDLEALKRMRLKSTVSVLVVPRVLENCAVYRLTAEEVQSMASANRKLVKSTNEIMRK